jgi:hypothetical protein
MKHLFIPLVLTLTIGLTLSLGSLVVVSRNATYGYGAHGFPLGYFQTGADTACNGGFEYSFKGIFATDQCDRSFSDGGSLFFCNWLIWATIVFGSYNLIVWCYKKVAMNPKDSKPNINL